MPLLDDLANFGKGVISAPVKFVNTGAIQANEGFWTLKGQVDAMTGNRKALSESLRMQNAIRQQHNNGGLFGMGSFYSAEDARRGDPMTGVKKIGGGTLETAATILPFAKGGSVAVGIGKGSLKRATPKLLGEGAVYGGMYSSGQQLREKGRIDPGQLAIDTALGAGANLAVPAALRGGRIAAQSTGRAGMNTYRNQVAPAAQAASRRVLASKPADYFFGDKMPVRNAQRIANPRVPASTSVKPSTAPVDDVAAAAQAYHQQALKINDHFQSNIQKTADTLGLKYFAGPVKKAERIQEKALADYSGDIMRVQDSVRGTMELHNPAEVAAIIKQLESQHDVVRVKNGYENEISGYTDVKINIRTPDGHVGEIILATPEMLKAKNDLGGHHMYNEWRTLDLNDPKYLELEKKMNDLYAEAHQAAVRRVASSSESNRPSKTALAAGNGLPVSKTVAAAELPSETNLTTTSSTSKNRVPGVRNSSDGFIADAPSSLNVAQKASNVNTPVPDQKPSRFANRTVQNSDEVSTNLKKSVAQEEVSYTPTTNAGRLEAADQFLANKTNDQAYTHVVQRLANAGRATDQDIVTGIQAAKRLDASGTEEDMLKATEIYSELSRVLSKKGQEVQAAALLANRTPEGLLYGAARDLKKAGIETTPEQQAAMRGIVDRIRKLDPNSQEAAFERYQLAKLVSDLIPAGKATKIANFWRAGLLTAPTTTGGNIVGNTGEALTRKLFVNPVATAVDVGLSQFTGKRSMAMGGGFSEGVKEGTGKLGQFMKTGFDERNALSKYDTREINYGNDGIGKLLGNYVNGTYRLMSLADQPFWYGARQESLRSLGKAEALNQGLKGEAQKDFITQFVKNPPKEAIERATQEAKYGTHQNDTMLGTAATSLKTGLRQKSDAAGAAADFFLPFTRVPASIATKVIKRTPIGTANEAVQQFLKIKAGGQFDQRAMSQAIAEGSFGPAVASAGYALAKSGQLTFGYPEDAQERKLWEAEGKQPYSVKVGDRWYSLNYLQPFGTLLAVGGEAHNAEKDGTGFGDAASRALATAGQAVMNQSFLKGVSGVLDAIDDPKHYAENYVENTAGSAVPNFIRSFARATDPLQREVAGTAEGIQGAIPGLRQGLPAKQDLFGQDMKAEDNFGNQYLNPLRPSIARDQDPIINELRRLKETDNGVVPSQANTAAFKGMKLTPEEVRELNAAAGSMLKQEYQRVMATAEYQQLDDASKKKTLENINDIVYGGIRTAYGQHKGYTDNELNRKQAKFLNGQEVNFIKKVGEDGKVIGGGIDINTKISGESQGILSEYDSMDSTERDQWFNAENDAEFKYKLAKYENDLANGTLTAAQRIRAESDLVKEKIGSNFSKEVRDLYGLSKAQLATFADESPENAELALQVLAYGQALVDAGLYKYNKHSGSGGVGGGRGRGGGKAQLTKSESRSDDIAAAANATRAAANAKVNAGRSGGFQNKINRPGLQAYKKPAKTTVRSSRA